ncbi:MULTISPECIES: dienelactone hydrolase family protein [Gracilibacillus]|uniref:dienelactone hydrolase family protein n=1 Tax=Gracilibacillus TaxID=74385 RepID=UPI000826B61A|nr:MULTISPECIES: alpha/beta hydrolase family protein [Gracilibacillus]
MNQEDQLFDQFYQNALEESVKAVGPAERRSILTNTLLELLGDFSYLNDTRVPFQTRVLETKDCERYHRDLIALSVTELVEIKMFILTPKTNQEVFPSVLAVHGHGYGVHEAVGLTKDGEKEENTIHHQFAIQLVNQGFKVFVPEVIGFGERRLTRDIEAGNENSCESMATNLLMEGKTLAGLRIWEARCILDYIEEDAQVDANNIAMMGFSGGGLVSAFTATLDTRVKATVLTGFANTFKGSTMAMHHCIDNYIPGILAVAELPEWIALIAPRSLFIESGENDPIFPSQYTKEAIEEISEYYTFSPEKFSYDIFPGAHEVSGRKAYNWLQQQLLQGKGG